MIGKFMKLKIGKQIPTHRHLIQPTDIFAKQKILSTLLILSKNGSNFPLTDPFGLNDWKIYEVTCY